ncbi:MAG: thymidylate synthase [Hyphomicrobiales bacterium]|nr:MAG: thymidylate synthase [Hyphomicrobiales bacterium]
MFHASEDSIDDLMRAVFKKLLARRGTNEVVSSKGKSTEIFGALLELRNPRARLSRSFSRAKAFSPLGELFWYLAGDESLEFIKHYIASYPEFSNDGVKINGAYGPRIFGLGTEKMKAGKSQWDRVINNLKERPGSRNAVIQIFANSDDKPRNKDKPCTCTLQFAIRNKQLLMHTHMRSNDAFLGLPHDLFSFTMLQEIAARELEVGLGTYTHSVTSLHLYHDRIATKNLPTNNSATKAQAYFDEGLHDFVPMPEMPSGNPWRSINIVKKAEKAIRLGDVEYQNSMELDQYWSDLIELFRIHKIFKELDKQANGRSVERPQLRRIVEIKNRISPVYGIYILGRLEKKLPTVRDLFENTDKGV